MKFRARVATAVSAAMALVGAGTAAPTASAAEGCPSGQLCLYRVGNYIDMRFQTGTAKGRRNLHKYYLSTTTGQIASYRNNMSVSAKLWQKSVTWQETGAIRPGGHSSDSASNPAFRRADFVCTGGALPPANWPNL
ncbi:peptidase inhibitor family I36 protein [Streptomyces sp. 135]|uniref:peptidase inhibitor family I36 protein n=1 Tax=Streptomyces sp. 135 TaxID=2838850 RepID=UPI001CBB05F6|nr:peptidase inhibitor family I36 protein [Streptomyces sp. 135]